MSPAIAASRSLDQESSSTAGVTPSDVTRQRRPRRPTPACLRQEHLGRHADVSAQRGLGVAGPAADDGRCQLLSFDRRSTPVGGGHVEIVPDAGVEFGGVEPLAGISQQMPERVLRARAEDRPATRPAAGQPERRSTSRTAAATQVRTRCLPSMTSSCLAERTCGRGVALVRKWAATSHDEWCR